MLKRLPKYFMFLLVIYLSKTNASAQSSTDNTNQAKVYANVVSDFYKKIGPQSRLYNGTQYNLYEPNIKGNAYYNDINTWNKGSVFYDGYLYKNVNMMYDIYEDELVILLYNNFMMVKLITEKVESFDLYNHHFIYIKNDPSSNSLKNGFYDELYSGKIQVLAKKTKSIQISTDYTGKIVPYFSPAKDYYLFRNGKYYKVNSQNAFLDALRDHKKELRQFIRSNNLTFKKTPEQSMTAIAAYYDQLPD